MSNISMNALLMQMRALADQARIIPELQTPPSDFSAVMGQALEKVNETQLRAAALAETFDRGGSEVDLTEVVVSMLKANVSFQAVTQVRNRLLTAYQEIMNMPI